VLQYQRTTLASHGIIWQFTERAGDGCEVAFNVGGTWKLTKHLNLLFSGGRDIVGDTHEMAYIGLQLLTK
jgi:hypothetical protein